MTKSTTANAKDQGGRISKTNTRTMSYTFNQLATYDRIPLATTPINLLLGHEILPLQIQLRQRREDGYREESTNWHRPSRRPPTTPTSSHNYAIESYLSRFNYGYKNRYYLDASWRTDGSSRFLDKWGHFWSVGAFVAAPGGAFHGGNAFLA